MHKQQVQETVAELRPDIFRSWNPENAETFFADFKALISKKLNELIGAVYLQRHFK